MRSIFKKDKPEIRLFLGNLADGEIALSVGDQLIKANQIISFEIPKHGKDHTLSVVLELSADNVENYSIVKLHES